MRRLLSILGIGLAVWVLYAMQKTMPTYGDITSPIVIEANAGDRLIARNFELTVKKITVAREIKLAAFGNERSYGTSGIWALVEADAAARDETITLTSAAWLGPDDVRYTASERISNAPGLLGLQRLEPGLTARVLMIFEFPESELLDGKILVARAPFRPLDDEMHIAANLSAKAIIHSVARVIRGRSGGDWSVATE